MLLLYAVAAGLVLGRVTGGHLDPLATVRFRLWWLALGGLVFQLLLFAPPIADRIGALGAPLYVASSALVFVAVLPNLREPGFGLIAIGAALNLVAIVANGGYMPSSPEGWLWLNGEAIVPVAGYTNSALISEHTLLPFLGDIFVLPRPLPFANVFSIGDVLIGLGAIVFLVRTMHGDVHRIAPSVPGLRGPDLESASRQ
jgi:hypothetical protein